MPDPMHPAKDPDALTAMLDSLLDLDLDSFRR